MTPRLEAPRERRRWNVALSLLVVGGVAGLGLVLVLAGLAARGPRALSAALHSALLSDYGADPLGARASPKSVWTSSRT